MTLIYFEKTAKTENQLIVWLDERLDCCFILSPPIFLSETHFFNCDSAISIGVISFHQFFS